MEGNDGVNIKPNDHRNAPGEYYDPDGLGIQKRNNAAVVGDSPKSSCGNGTAADFPEVRR